MLQFWNIIAESWSASYVWERKINEENHILFGTVESIIRLSEISLLTVLVKEQDGKRILNTWRILNHLKNTQLNMRLPHLSGWVHDALTFSNSIQGRRHMGKGKLRWSGSHRSDFFPCSVSVQSLWLQFISSNRGLFNSTSLSWDFMFFWALHERQSLF